MKKMEKIDSASFQIFCGRSTLPRRILFRPTSSESFKVLGIVGNASTESLSHISKVLNQSVPGLSQDNMV
jgi:hypothetical protein